MSKLRVQMAEKLSELNGSTALQEWVPKPVAPEGTDVNRIFILSKPGAETLSASADWYFEAPRVYRYRDFARSVIVYTHIFLSLTHETRTHIHTYTRTHTHSCASGPEGFGRH